MVKCKSKIYSLIRWEMLEKLKVYEFVRFYKNCAMKQVAYFMESPRIRNPRPEYKVSQVSGKPRVHIFVQRFCWSLDEVIVWCCWCNRAQISVAADESACWLWLISRDTWVYSIKHSNVMRSNRLATDSPISDVSAKCLYLFKPWCTRRRFKMIRKNFTPDM